MTRLWGVGFLVPLLSCTRMKSTEPRSLLQPTPPPYVQVSVQSVGQVLVREPRLVAGDSLGGYVDGEYETIALSRITEIREPQSAPLQTLLLVGVPVVVGTVAIYELAKAPEPAPVCNLYVPANVPCIPQPPLPPL
jgi:hypothetical protein